MGEDHSGVSAVGDNQSGDGAVGDNQSNDRVLGDDHSGECRMGRWVTIWRQNGWWEAPSNRFRSASFYMKWIPLRSFDRFSGLPGLICERLLLCLDIDVNFQIHDEFLNQES